MRLLVAGLAVALMACDGQTTLRPTVSARTAPVSTDTALTLRAVLHDRASVGRRVRVQGRCIAPAWEYQLGRPPRLVNGWQLEADGVAVFVVGPLPRACAEGSSHAMITILALVAEDSLPAIGDLPPSPRRYLVQLALDHPDTSGS